MILFLNDRIEWPQGAIFTSLGSLQIRGSERRVRKVVDSNAPRQFLAKVALGAPA
jgi:hypothetical protein